MRHLLLISLLLAFTSPAHAEKYSAEVWTNTFYAMSDDDALLAKSNPYPKNSPLFNIHHDYQRDSFRNEKFVAKLITTLNAQEGFVQDSTTLGVAIAEEIVMSGLKKLNDGDKERLLSLILKMMVVANDHQCAEFFRGSEQAKKNTYPLLMKMAPTDVTQYYQLLKNAMNAELNDVSVTPVTESQGKVVIDALGSKLAKSYSLESIKKYTAIADSPTSYGDADMCWFGGVTLYSFLSLQGDVKKWAVRQWFE